MVATNLELGQQVQTKFHFYMVSLVFTILGLAVETAKFGGPRAAGIFELFAWFCLFISGVIALFRFEAVPQLYQIFEAHNDLESEKARILGYIRDGHHTVHDQRQGKDIPIVDYGNHLEVKLLKVTELETALQDRANWLYHVHRWLFVIGVGSLVMSRGFGFILQLVHYS